MYHKMKTKELKTADEQDLDIQKRFELCTTRINKATECAWVHREMFQEVK
jgi:hypothetical protein